MYVCMYLQTKVALVFDLWAEMQKAGDTGDAKFIILFTAVLKKLQLC